jgi:hypothetical protein
VGFKLTTLVVIGTDCIGSCKSNYHTITNMTITALQFPDSVTPQVYRKLLPVISQVPRFIGPLVLQYHMIPDPTKLQVHGPLILQYHRFINFWSYNTTGYYVIGNTILQHHMIPDHTISQVLRNQNFTSYLKYSLKKKLLDIKSNCLKWTLNCKKTQHKLTLFVNVILNAMKTLTNVTKN